MFVFIILHIFRPSPHKGCVNPLLNMQDSHNSKFVKEMDKKCEKKKKKTPPNTSHSKITSSQEKNNQQRNGNPNNSLKK
jgi:hypothetical protein